MSTTPARREKKIEAALREIRETLAFCFADDADDRESFAGCLIAMADAALSSGAEQKCSHGLPWSGDELDVLRLHYPLGGTLACLLFLPGRSKSAIKMRAKYLGLSSPSTRMSPDRLAELRHLYEAETDTPLYIIAARFGTSRGAIKRLADRHGWKSRSAARMERDAHA